MTDGQEEEQGYRLLDPAEFEGVYTPEEVALDRRLCEACCCEELDAALVEELLRQGADPLGALDTSGWDVLEHVYERVIVETREMRSIHLPKITELFLAYGMDVAKPRIPYDGDNSLHPMWSFSFIANENAIVALQMLLEHGLDAASAGEFWGHSIDDQIGHWRDDPNGEWNDWFVWTMKMIMLIASYDHILDSDEGLRDLIWYQHNNYDIHGFRHWDDYEYRFDTSRCDGYPRLRRCVIRIYERASGEAVWRFAISLSPQELI